MAADSVGILIVGVLLLAKAAGSAAALGDSLERGLLCFADTGRDSVLAGATPRSRSTD